MVSQSEIGVKGSLTLNLLRSIHAGDVSGSVAALKKDFYEKHLNPDHLEVEQYALWALCQVILQDKELPAADKATIYTAVVTKLQSTDQDSCVSSAIRIEGGSDIRLYNNKSYGYDCFMSGKDVKGLDAVGNEQHR